MSEWWTYRPHDLLMYSARAYYGRFARENWRVFPLQFPALAAGVATVVLLLLGTPRERRIAIALLAAAWCAVAWAFFVVEYSMIHTFARGFAVAFVVEAALLAVAGIRGDPAPFSSRWANQRIGALLAAVALTVGLLLPPFTGRAWVEAEFFALAPDPTVGVTFAALLLIPRSRWWLWVIPVLWTVYNGMTLWMLHAPGALVLPAIGVAAMVTRVLQTAGRRLPGVDVA